MLTKKQRWKFISETMLPSQDRKPKDYLNLMRRKHWSGVLKILQISMDMATTFYVEIEKTMNFQ